MTRIRRNLFAVAVLLFSLLLQKEALASWWSDQGFDHVWSSAGLTGYADGDAIGTWTDDVAGESFTATGALRPTKRSIRGSSYAEFNGTTPNRMTTATAFITSAYNQAFTLVLGYKQPNTNAITATLATNAGGGNLFFFGPQSTNLNSYRVPFATVVDKTFPSRTGEEQGVFVFSYDGTNRYAVSNLRTRTEAQVGTLGFPGQKLTLGDLEAPGGFPSTCDIYFVAVRRAGCASMAEAQQLHRRAWLETHRECMNIVVNGNSLSTTISGVANPWPTILGSRIGYHHNVDSTLCVSGKQTSSGGPHLSGSGFVMLDDQAALTALYNAGATRNIHIFWEGTNDLFNIPNTPAQAWANYAAYATMARRAGFDYLVGVDILSRGNSAATWRDGSEFNRLFNNGIMRYCDAAVRFGPDPRLGYPGAETNATYFNGDNIHLNNATGQPLIADLMSSQINSLIQKRTTTTENGGVFLRP